MVQWLCLFKDEINITSTGRNDRVTSEIYKVSGKIGSTGVANNQAVWTSTNDNDSDRVQPSDETTFTSGDEAQPSDARNDVRHDETDDDDEATDLCCVKGFLTITSLALLFFVVLPAGALVTLYSSKNDDRELLVVGVLLIVLPVASVPVVIAVILNRRRIRRLKKRRRRGPKGEMGLADNATARY